MSASSFRALINKTIINRLQRGDTVWDTQLKGFGARRQAHSVTYVMKAFHGGRQHWITIGKHGLPWSPSTARKRALELKISPETAPIATTIARKKLTLEELVPHYKTNHYPKISPRTQKDYDDVFDRYIIPALGKKTITTIAYSDIAEFHSNLSHIPRRANLSLATLSNFMKWAEQTSYRPRGSNPCSEIKKYPENKRERFLSIAELTVLGVALNDAEQADRISVHAAAAIRLLIFTGARVSEILTLQWAFVHLDTRKLLLPKSKTGRKTINLNPQSIEILTALPRLASNPYVIIGKRIGAHLVNISKPWGIIRTAAQITDVRLHDLRHSFASVAAAEGASLPMIGKLLGHTQTQTTARYAHLTEHTVAALNDQIGATIGKVLDKKSG